MKSPIRINLACFVLIFLLIAGCGSGAGSGSDNLGIINLKPGELRLAKMDGMESTVSVKANSSFTLKSNVPSSITFNLGVIKASQQYYFLLSNSGDYPVTNVTFTTSNQNFVASPGMIDSVAPQSQGFVSPVIKVSVTHGVALNGIGYTNSLLSMGNNTCTLTITGTTTDSSGSVIPLSYDIQFNVYAEVMDIAVSGIDLRAPIGLSQSLVSSDVPIYRTATVLITNNGNVDLTIKNLRCDITFNFAVFESVIIHPTETKQMSYPLDTNLKCIFLKIESNNTIADYSKLRFKPDGTLWLMFDNY